MLILIQSAKHRCGYWMRYLYKSDAVAGRVPSKTLSALFPLNGLFQLMLEFLYQLIKVELFGKLTLDHHPEFLRLRQPAEPSAKFRCLPPSELLQRWSSYHLKRAAVDIARQSLLLVDLRDLVENLLPKGAHGDLRALAAQAGVQGCVLMDERSVGNIPLQQLFLAQLAHAAPGLAPLTAAESEEARDLDPEGTREERAFVTWINGLGIPTFITNLQYDMSDGLVLLHTLDKIEHGYHFDLSH